MTTKDEQDLFSYALTHKVRGQYVAKMSDCELITTIGYLLEEALLSDVGIEGVERMKGDE